MSFPRAGSPASTFIVSLLGFLFALLVASGGHAADADPSRLSEPEVAAPESRVWPQRVLITNDNGIADVATQALARAFARHSEVVLVASTEDRSSGSNFMTFPRARRFVVERRDAGEGIRAWALDGFPADCVVFALVGPMADAPPDLVVSGINGGANLADEWFGSGTIGAARTAAFLGVPAVAVSGVEDDDPEAVEAVVEWVLRLVRSGIMDEIRPPSYLTVSLPARPPSEITGIEVVERAHGLLSASAQLESTASHGPGQAVWSIELGTRGRPGLDTDVAAVARGHIAVVPMRVGDRDPAMLEWLRQNDEILPEWRPSPPPATAPAVPPR